MRLYAPLVVLCLAVAPIRASAAPPEAAPPVETAETAETDETPEELPPTMSAATQEAFERGRAQYEVGEYGRAVSAWKEALGLAPADGPVVEARLMLNVSTAYEKLFDTSHDATARESALEYLGRYEAAIDTAYLGAPALAGQERQRVADRRTRLEAKATPQSDEGLSTIFDTPAASADPSATTPVVAPTTPEGPEITNEELYKQAKRHSVVGGVFSGIALLNVVGVGILSAVQAGGANLLGPIIGLSVVGVVTGSIGLGFVISAKKKKERASKPQITAVPVFGHEYGGIAATVRF